MLGSAVWSMIPNRGLYNYAKNSLNQPKHQSFQVKISGFVGLPPICSMSDLHIDALLQCMGQKGPVHQHVVGLLATTVDPPVIPLPTTSHQPAPQRSNGKTAGCGDDSCAASRAWLVKNNNVEGQVLANNKPANRLVE